MTLGREKNGTQRKAPCIAKTFLQLSLFLKRHCYHLHKVETLYSKEKIIVGSEFFKKICLLKLSSKLRFSFEFIITKFKHDCTLLNQGLYFMCFGACSIFVDRLPFLQKLSDNFLWESICANFQGSFEESCLPCRLWKWRANIWVVQKLSWWIGWERLMVMTH